MKGKMIKKSLVILLALSTVLNVFMCTDGF